MRALLCIVCTLTVASAAASSAPSVPLDEVYPIVINTWPFVNATAKAWEVVSSGRDSAWLDDRELGPEDVLSTRYNPSLAAFVRRAIDEQDPLALSVAAVEAGCGTCEIEQCDGSVGFGGSPDESGETTLDAMVMDGTNMDVGAVGDIRNIKNAIGVARHVLHYTTHTLLAGNQATSFAVEMGFQQESLETPASHAIWQNWQNRDCQPNYWRDVSPNNTASCGPYTPNPSKAPRLHRPRIGLEPRPTVSRHNHDTIAMIVIDPTGQHVVSGTSTNGLTYKVAGRVGDSPIAGAGSFADSTVGGCGATGDGDIMMRFLPCYQAVESMRQGMSPKEAAEDAMARIISKYPVFQGAIVVVNKAGEHAGAATGWTFVYSLRTPTSGGVVTVTVPPMKTN